MKTLITLVQQELQLAAESSSLKPRIIKASLTLSGYQAGSETLKKSVDFSDSEVFERLPIDVSRNISDEEESALLKLLSGSISLKKRSFPLFRRFRQHKLVLFFNQAGEIHCGQMGNDTEQCVSTVLSEGQNSAFLTACVQSVDKQEINSVPAVSCSCSCKLKLSRLYFDSRRFSNLLLKTVLPELSLGASELSEEKTDFDKTAGELSKE
ncbi:MAG: hypothetical protein IAB19_01630 [Proteobacteria bacterium]|uniref:Uncharacterized protein n=1 Tax=Candidatus Avisuccinivibrio stercorigallinarum TaxID=2840704 RepID=A0A9D9DBI5_9GAMM|nr:hypothetical protein [Candidatus Avisuccinivibrio stercorigallinarum]